MKTIKKTAFIALGLLLSASVAQAIVESGNYAGSGAMDTTYHIQPHGPVVVNPDNTYRTQPYGPVTVNPEKSDLKQSVIVHPGTTTPITKGTPAQVGYQAQPGVYGNVPTSYQAPVAGTPAQVGYQADTMNNTKAQGYIPPTVSEKDLE